MKYKLISKQFHSMNAAETFLFGLYDKHEHARCIAWPSDSGKGKYTFEVSDNTNAKLIPVVHSKAGKVQIIISSN